LAKNVSMNASLFRQLHSNPIPNFRPSKNLHFGTVHRFHPFAFRLDFENLARRH
jgi:hypothetical protein